jgi:hypothetical protein
LSGEICLAELVDAEDVEIRVAMAVLVATKVGRVVNVEVVTMVGVGRDAELRDNWNVHPLVITTTHNIAKATGVICLCIMFSFLNLCFADHPHHIMSDRGSLEN